MNNSLLLKRIQKTYPRLTPREKSVAEYLVENYQKSAFLTCIEIGKAAGVSDTTVIRLTNSLGYDGFAEMRKELQGIVEKEITPREQLSTTIKKMVEKDYMQEVFELEKQNLDKTFGMIDLESIGHVVELLCKARKIFAMGLGLSAAPVRFFSYRLRRIQKDVVEINSSGYSLVEKISMLSISKKDVLIVLDFPRYSKDVYKTMRFVKNEIGATIVLVTDNWLNPQQEFSDITIIGYNDSLGFTNSIIGSAFIINIISVGVILKEQHKALAHLKKIEEFSQLLGHSM